MLNQSGKYFCNFLLLFNCQLGWELYVKDNAEFTAFFVLAVNCISRTLFFAFVFHESFSLNNFDASRWVDLVDCKQHFSSIKRCQLDWFALDYIAQISRVLVDKTVSMTHEFGSIWSSFASHHFKLDIEVCRFVFFWLVAESFHFERLRLKHSWSDEDINWSRLCFESTSIESNDLFIVGNIFLCSIEELFKWSVNSNVDVVRLWWGRLSHASKCGSKVTTLNFTVCSFDVCQVSAQVKERILFEEEFVENFIAILLVLIAASKDTIWSLYSSSETLISVRLIHSSKLLVTEHLVSFTDCMELWQVHSHLCWVFLRMIFETILLEPESYWLSISKIVTYAVLTSSSSALRLSLRTPK